MNLTTNSKGRLDSQYIKPNRSVGGPAQKYKLNRKSAGTVDGIHPLKDAFHP